MRENLIYAFFRRKHKKHFQKIYHSCLKHKLKLALILDLLMNGLMVMEQILKI